MSDKFATLVVISVTMNGSNNNKKSCCGTRVFFLTLILSVPNLAKRQILEPYESTGRELSFVWSHHRISSTDSKVRHTLQNSIIYFGSERGKRPMVKTRTLLVALSLKRLE